MKKILVGARIVVAGLFMLSAPNILADPLLHLLKKPPPPPAPLAKTGQKTAYAAGDDGDLEKGVPWPNPRFTDYLNGTVRDNLTGLIWLKNNSCYGARTWQQAGFGGYSMAPSMCGTKLKGVATDWRLPNLREMESITRAGSWEDTVPDNRSTVFGNIRREWYWTSTSQSEYNAYQIDVLSNEIRIIDKTITARAWPVRGGQ